ncbi:CGNR zinc finger domain-containing protein [Streptomyces sp. URMC 123]|uniref:CGNR zinc finger domain-containing protein n=1 Tax=Streptomyces sp. URMC 123 TaxID=3423403 RepID=UPI003F1A826D
MTGTGSTAPARPRVGVSLIGGHPVLDFVNTVAWRTDDARRAARVDGVAAWLDWAAAAGLFTAYEAAELLAGAPGDDTRAARSAIAALEALRGALGAVLDAMVDDTPAPVEQWEVLRRSIVAAREEAVLPPALPLRWRVRPAGFADLAHALALSADELLASPSVQRVRRCQGPGCGWFFLDRSRSGTRRWCSSGDCGNRDRARRHYHRHHG